MSKKPETVFKEKIMPLLKAIPESWAEKIQQVGKRGTADILCCFSGLFVAIELKKDLAELHKQDSTSTLQNYKLQKIMDARGISLKICPENWQENYDFLKSIKGEMDATKKKTINALSGRSTKLSGKS